MKVLNKFELTLNYLDNERLELYKFYLKFNNIRNNSYGIFKQILLSQYYHADICESFFISI